jgi:glycosyltransferase involved in cell wall biosynthesis
VRLMVVGHPFLLAYNQQKYVAMKRLDKNLHLRLVVPTRWCERFESMDYQIHPELSAEEVVPLKSYMAKSHMTYVHDLGPLAAVLRSFEPDVIHVEEEPQAVISVETIALRTAFAPRAAVILFTWDNILRPRSFPLGVAKRRLRAYSLRRASAVICGNREAAELLRAEGRFSGNIEVLPQYGLNATEHQPGTESQLRTELGLNGAPVVGYFGRMVPEKGLRLLFEALGRLLCYPWKLLLVGSGPLEEEIRERWMAALPGRVVLLPSVSYEQVPRYLRCADVFVLASQSTPAWKEQFGLALAQAMVLGIASIGSNCGAIPDTLGPGGTIVEQHDAEGLKRALEKFLTSPTCRQRAATAGREFALQNYTVERIAAQYLNAFERARSYHNAGRDMMSESLGVESLGRKI